MKKLILILFSCILIAALLSGCSGKPADEVKAAEAKAAEDTKKAVDNAMEAMETLTNKEWPTENLPSELPEYTEGEIVNSGGNSEDFIVKIDKTNKDALSTYLGKLKDLGWHVEEGKESIAEKGIYELRFTWQGDDHLQINLYTSEVRAWPADKMPPDVIPPSEGTLIGGAELYESVPGQIWYTNYTYDGINEEKANAYIDMLISKGWSGDSSMISKDMEWNGKKYHATIELYETNENSSTFTLNLELR
ncbi:MAG TPA: hypothetical protein VEG39_10125 [Clostridia bacterium]|nr:hypothetical protein [Clostridia bacterium]